ncbi:hypothetical protein GCM10022225_49710 [Plantactinospora mayteni]|uniref:Uncharacterized protein n=1 Tax=Plantactinospora mayteni TaxID=566021 RepID=A0ABQ4EXX5_9ACTN|nr:hypothetical protein Pma05_60420 [Plantactinospora mayteni]
MQPDRSGSNGLRAGDLVYVGRSASVQFGGTSAFLFRVIRVDNHPTYYGWAWLDGYQLDGSRNAVTRRQIYVQAAGLRRVPKVPAPSGRTSNVRRLDDMRASLRNARVPRGRT